MSEKGIASLEEVVKLQDNVCDIDKVPDEEISRLNSILE